MSMRGEKSNNGPLELKPVIITKVINKRVHSGRTEYLVKKKTLRRVLKWEVGDLLHHDLIESYERELEEKGMNAMKDNPYVKAMGNLLTSEVILEEYNGDRKKLDVVEANNGFKRNLKPRKILGSTEEDGKLYFLMEWEGACVDFVPAEEADLRCPDIVIAYYEKRLKFH